MRSFIKISDASIIAIHAVDYISKHKNKTVSAREIAKNLNISYNHLSKVLQRLTAANILTTTRGPAGGYFLTKEGEKVTIRQLIEIMEGKKQYQACLMSSMTCNEKVCIFRDFLSETLKNFNKVLNTKITEMHK